MFYFGVDEISNGRKHIRFSYKVLQDDMTINCYNGIRPFRIYIPDHIWRTLHGSYNYVAAEDWSWVVRLGTTNWFKINGEQVSVPTIIPVYGEYIGGKITIISGVNLSKTVYYSDDELRMQALFSSKEEAEKELKKRKMTQNMSYGVYLRYGSDHYGESRDVDGLHLRVNHYINYDEAVRLYQALTLLKDASSSYSNNDDTVHIDQYSMGAFERLAIECAAVEYPNVRQATAGWHIWNIRLEDAIAENTAMRRELGEKFPSDFTLRKAVFATLQKQLYLERGVFADTKKILVDIATPEQRRLLYHQADDNDRDAVYQQLFGHPKPEDVVVVSARRVFWVYSNGRIYKSDYSSDYGYGELEEMQDVDNSILQETSFVSLEEFREHYDELKFQSLL